MWFKNLQLFRIAKGVDLTGLDLALSWHPLVECCGLERSRVGWVRAHYGYYAYQQSGQYLIAFGLDEKILPAAVVRQFAEAAIAKLESGGSRIGRKSRKQFYEQVEDELLPRAFSKRTTVYAWIDPVNGWLVVNSSGAAKAEAVVKLLGEAVPELSIKLPHTQLSPGAAMTGWLAGNEAPTGFTIDRDGELRLPGEDRATVRYVHHALDGEDIGEHIASGKQATRLGLTWADRVSFVLTEKLEIKRLQFLDILKEQSEQAEDAEAMFQIEFSLMSGELTKLIADLVEALGGEVD